jgi:hypothetical protein
MQTTFQVETTKDIHWMYMADDAVDEVEEITETDKNTNEQSKEISTSQNTKKNSSKMFHYTSKMRNIIYHMYKYLFVFCKSTTKEKKPHN